MIFERVERREQEMERERERERNIAVRKIDQLPPIGALTWDQTHNQGLNLQPKYMRWQGTTTIWYEG